MIQEWLNSERICLDYIAKSISWLDQFYVDPSKLFVVAYSTGDHISQAESPNAASSIISYQLHDLKALYVNLADIPGWSEISHKSNEALNAIAAASVADALPLKSFGVLPLFSICYLAESLASAARPLAIPSYAVAIRRILYELYLQQRRHGSRLSQTDPLHPFLLFGCTKALRDFRMVEKTSSPSDKETFTNNLTNEDLLKSALLTRLANEPTYVAVEDLMADAYGTSSDASDFRMTLRSVCNPTSAVPSPVDDGLQALELRGLNNALSELAKLNNSKSGLVDPSSLVFSLNVLSLVNLQRHAQLITQALTIVLKRCEQGERRSTLPFHIDKKGRATFVPFVVVLNAALELVLSLIDKRSPEQVAEYIDNTNSIQDYYSELYNTVEVHASGGTVKEMRGWCADTAPSLTRIDSWVTVHFLVFFVRRLSLIRHAIRHETLRSYSWIPHQHIQPAWEDIVDPDYGLHDRSVKSLIGSLVEYDSGQRKKSPVFLLYGPPGTSKTTLVQGIARKMGWDLITLSPSDFIAESLDLIEQQSRQIFRDLMNIDECVILLDEMDSLLRDRELLASKSQSSVIEFVVPAFLPKLQQLRDYALKKRIAVFFVTNYYEMIDRAIRRAGRIDSHVLVLPYNKTAQITLLTQLLHKVFDAEPHLESRAIAFVRQLIEGNIGLLRLITYREAETLSELIAREVRNGATPSNENIEEWSLNLSITPDVYSKRDINAFREVCAVVSRLVQDDVPNSTFTGMTMENAKTYLEDKQPVLRNTPWYSLSKKWSGKLEAEISRRAGIDNDN